MIQSESRQIGDTEYTVSQFGSKKALEVFGRFIVLAAGPVAAILDEAGDIKSLGDIDVKVLAGAFREVATKQLSTELQWFADQVVPCVQIPGAGGLVPLKPVYELHFAGKIHELLQLIWFSMEVNFGGFLGVLESLGARAQATAKP